MRCRSASAGLLWIRATGIARISELKPLFAALGPFPGRVAFDCPVHRRPRNAEQVAGLSAGVFAGLHQGDQTGFLPRIQFGLLAPQRALRLRGTGSFPMDEVS
jgi:hypothetical protein